MFALTLLLSASSLPVITLEIIEHWRPVVDGFFVVFPRVEDVFTQHEQRPKDCPAKLASSQGAPIGAKSLAWSELR
jgi:hypothetical protein